MSSISVLSTANVISWIAIVAVFSHRRDTTVSKEEKLAHYRVRPSELAVGGKRSDETVNAPAATHEMKLIWQILSTIKVETKNTMQ